MFLGCESDLARRISAYEKTRDYESAKSLLERIVQRDTHNAEAQFLLGRLYMKDGAYVRARKALEASRDASPRFVERIDFLLEKNAREEFLKGKTALEAEDFAKAVRHFRHVTQIQPSNAVGHRSLGHALVQTNRLRDAENAYRKALSLSPTDLETLNNLASLTFQREAYQACIEYSLRALDREMKKPEVVKRLAYAHAEAGQPDEAAQRFQQALQLDPSSELRRDFALLLFNEGKYQQALPLLRRLSRGNEPDAEILRVLGETYYGLEDYQNAVDTYLRLHDRFPEDTNVLQNIVIAFEQLEQYDKADAYRKRLSNTGGASNE